MFAHPSREFVAWHAGEVSDVIEAMQGALASGHYLAGYFSYELGYALEPRLQDSVPEQRKAPLLWFGQYDQPPTVYRGADAQALWPEERVYASPLRFEWDRETYRARFEHVMEAIRRGDAYQVNLSMRATFRITGDPRALFRQLRSAQASTYAAYVDDGERQILSVSPELFFAVDASGCVTTRPMKGTARRDPDSKVDEALRNELASGIKNRAENLMIVDLIRNDLGRLAVTGTVEVPELFTVETYPTVHQMTSTVRARLPSGYRIHDILDALYPCGSITGAPKIRSMQIIRGLEDSARGVYCGAIGMFSPDGSALFNVAIRTLTITRNEGELGVGGAVVSDSDADLEYDECLLKARYYDAARRPMSLIETLPYRDGRWYRLRGHLRRMRDSAATLNLPFHRSAIIAALRGVVSEKGDGSHKVRLSISDQGVVDAQCGPAPTPAHSLRYVIARSYARSSDPLRAHKTDWRDACDQALAWARAHGADEAIMLNERNEICEGSYTNVFVEAGGGLLTPPLRCGALPGRLRAELLASGRCVEAVLTEKHLQGDAVVYLGNSLRGLIRAEPHDDREIHPDTFQTDKECS